MIKETLRKLENYLLPESISQIVNQHRIKFKFLMVGGWNTVFGIGIFILLYKLFSKIYKVDYFAYTTAQIIGIILSVINAYIFHKYITFNSKVKGKKMIIEFMKFSTTYAVLFVVSLVIMPFFVEIIKIKPIPASICLNVVIIFTSYFGHSRFSFKK
jgi:putative flippase GtrA